MGALLASHEGAARTKESFGYKSNVEWWEGLVRVAVARVPLRVREGEDLRVGLANGNHRSATKHDTEVLTKGFVGKVAMGRSVIFRAEGARRIEGLRISPVKEGAGEGGGKYQDP